MHPAPLDAGGENVLESELRLATGVVVDDARVVILDEPTAALGVRQTANVLALARALADRGAAVVMITHDTDSVMQVADHVVVLNLGRVVHDSAIAEVTAGQLVHLMAGLDDGSPSHAATRA